VQAHEGARISCEAWCTRAGWPRAKAGVKAKDGRMGQKERWREDELDVP
jgi:hypothetical protein